MNKILKSMAFAVLLAGMVMGVSSCGDNEPEPTQSIMDYLTSQGVYTNFLAGVEKAGLTSKITGSGAFTLLAVSDDQLEADGIDFADMTDQEITDVIMYHYKEGKHEPSSFTNNGYTTTELAAGPGGAKLSVYTQVNGSAVTFNGKPSVINFQATNGIIYVMGGTLTPPTVMNHLAINPNISQYNVGARMEAAVKTALEAGNNTVFAVHNDPLLAYIQTFNVIQIKDIPPSKRRAVLNNTMVYGQSLKAGDLSGSIQTEGKSLSVSGAGANLTLDGKAKVTQPDIICKDGILHIIDAVIPE